MIPVSELVVRYARQSEIEASKPHRKPAMIYQAYLDAGGDNRARNGLMFEQALEVGLISAGIAPENILRHIQLLKGKKGSEADRIVVGDTRVTIIGCKTSGRERIGLDFGLAMFVYATGMWRVHPMFKGVEPHMYIVTRQEQNKHEPNPARAFEACAVMNRELNLGTPATLVTVLDYRGMQQMFADITSSFTRPQTLLPPPGNLLVSA